MSIPNRRKYWPGDQFAFALADPLADADIKLESLRHTARAVEMISPSMAASLAMEIENAVDALDRAGDLAFHLVMCEQFPDLVRRKRRRRPKAQTSAVRVQR